MSLSPLLFKPKCLSSASNSWQPWRSSSSDNGNFGARLLHDKERRGAGWLLLGVAGCIDLLCPSLEGEGWYLWGQVTPFHKDTVKGEEVCVHAVVALCGSCRPPLPASEDAKLRGFKCKDILSTPSPSKSLQSPFQAVIGSLASPLPLGCFLLLKQKVKECAAWIVLSDFFSLGQLASAPSLTDTHAHLHTYTDGNTSRGRARQEVTLHLCLTTDSLVHKAIWRLHDEPWDQHMHAFTWDP